MYSDDLLYEFVMSLLTFHFNTSLLAMTGTCSYTLLVSKLCSGLISEHQLKMHLHFGPEIETEMLT